MVFDMAEATTPRPPRGRGQPPVQTSRLLEAHAAFILEVRAGARRPAELRFRDSNDQQVVRTPRRSGTHARMLIGAHWFPRRAIRTDPKTGQRRKPERYWSPPNVLGRPT
jgi:hypothetical protein